MKNRPGPVSKIVLLASVLLAGLFIAVWLTPVAFTACGKDSLWCTFSFLLTESAGMYGTVIIILLAGIFYSLRFDTWRGFLFNLAKCILSLAVLLAAFAWLNEHVTKKLTRIPRPAHELVNNSSNVTIPIDSMYRLEEERRKEVIRGWISDSPSLTATLDPTVLEHWVEENGYSFPSGHSFNAFLLATVLSFGLLHSRRRFAVLCWFIPLTWAAMVAVSRVSLGAHSALDVSFGSAMGVLTGWIFLYFDNTRKWVVHRKEGQVVRKRPADNE